MISITLAIVGLALLIYRLWPRAQRPLPTLASWPRVSIIIPARNEEKNLPRLLQSLAQLDYPNFETIVVNDNSTDGTGAIARSFQGLVIDGQKRPADWFGKPWACHQGSLVAKGDFFLFTDADTVHRPESLKIAMAALIDRRASGLTALPFHQNPALWERLMGPFQLLLSALTNPYGRPEQGRVFAIGQYLLFPSSFYDLIGGHERIKAEAIEDIALARQTLAAGGLWHVHTGVSLYEVHMYETLMDFIKGWRRNFRGGMKHNSQLSSLEVVLFFMAMTIGTDGRSLSLAISVLTLTLLALTQGKLGRFSIGGILLLPFSMTIFTLVSALAAYDTLLARPLLWKNRRYDAAGSPAFVKKNASHSENASPL